MKPSYLALAACHALALASACSTPAGTASTGPAKIPGTATAESPPPAASSTVPYAAAGSTVSPPVATQGDGRGAKETPEAARSRLAAWMNQHLPPGGKVTDEAGKPLAVSHTTQAGDSLQSLAKAYVDYSTVYYTEDFAKHIAKQNPHVRWMQVVPAGLSVSVPDLIDEAPKSADDERLGWPEGGVMKGVFLHTVSDRFFYALEKMPPRGMNTIVLDAKDYDGWFTYPTKVAVAVETGAAKPANIRDYGRLVRFAHRKGVRVVARVCAFHDPHTAERAPRLSIRGKWGGPFPAGWLDPANPEAQDYISDVVKEVLDTGVDEIQLDYVRFIVQSGLKNAVLPPAGEARVTVIRDFVRKIHAITQARHVPLSLDVFGVAAFNRPEDVGNLGQDLTVLAKESEAISPMVYPSHYAAGFQGWKEPGTHPEIVGIGTKAAVEQVSKAGPGHAIIRPWLQAMSWKSPNFGPTYIAEEARTGTDAGGVGWLLWNPGEGYDPGYTAFPVTHPPR